MLPMLNERMRVDFQREKGHMHVDVLIVCEGSTDESKINFVYDTGAFLTIINRYHYEGFKLDKLPRKEITIGGYVGYAPGYMYQIPGLLVGQRLLTGVWAFSPKSKGARQNILGCNVLEYFLPFQDNHNDCFYFPDNPGPKPYIHPGTQLSLACESVMYVEDMK